MKSFRSPLPANFYDYWKKKLFTDCIIITQDKYISCHRIILSKNSKYFFRKFTSQDSNENEYVIDFNPHNCFENVISFLYSGDLDINISNIAPYTAIAQYYEIDALFSMADKAFNNLLQIDNVYNLINSFCSFKIHRYHQQIIDFMVPSFQNYKINNIIPFADSKFLSSLLNNLQIYTIDEKIQILDRYTKHHEFLTDIDKENLTTIYDFSSDNESYRFLIFNKCDWMVSSIQRTLLSMIIDKRNQLITDFNDKSEKSFEESSQTETDSSASLFTGKWSVFHYVSNISLIKDTNEVDLINYIRTFDGFIKPMNPIKLGLITVDHSTPISPQYGGANIFDSYYFASNKENGKYPFIKYSLGWNNDFIIKSFLLEAVSVKDKDKPKKPLIGPINIFLGNQQEEQFVQEISDPNNLFIFPDDSKLIPSTNFKMVMIDENSSGGWIFRFHYPKINGMFLLNFTKANI